MNNTYYYLIEIFGNIVDISIFFYLVHIFFECKKSQNKRTFIILSVILISILSKFSHDALGNATIISLILIIIIVYLISKFFYNVNITRYLLIMCFFIVIIGIVEMSVTSFITVIYDLPKNTVFENNNIYRVIALLTSKTLLISLIFFVSKFPKIRYVQIIPYTYLIILMLILNFSVVTFSINIYSGKNIQKESIYIIILSIVSVIISIISIFIIQRIILYCNNELIWKDSENQYKNILKHYKEYEILNDKISAERHDFINHIIAIQEFAKNSQNKKIITYTNSLLKNTQKINKILKIKNKTISSLINYKLLLIEQYNIEFKQYINVPDIIHVDDVDISIILGNALDNAIEACKNSDDKLINIYINYEKNHLKIMIANTKSTPLIYIGNKIQTKKEDKKNHGFGLKNIARSVKKYDGYFNIKDNDDLFTLEVFI